MIWIVACRVCGEEYGAEHVLDAQDLRDTHEAFGHAATGSHS